LSAAYKANESNKNNDDNNNKQQQNCKENIEALLDAFMEVDLVVNAEKIKYMLISCNQSTEQNYCNKIDNKSLWQVSFI
jgi:hypothetical protein